MNNDELLKQIDKAMQDESLDMGKVDVEEENVREAAGSAASDDNQSFITNQSFMTIDEISDNEFEDVDQVSNPQELNDKKPHSKYVTPEGSPKRASEVFENQTLLADNFAKNAENTAIEVKNCVENCETELICNPAESNIYEKNIDTEKNCQNDRVSNQQLCLNGADTEVQNIENSIENSVAMDTLEEIEALHSINLENIQQKSIKSTQKILINESTNPDKQERVSQHVSNINSEDKFVPLDNINESEIVDLIEENEVNPIICASKDIAEEQQNGVKMVENINEYTDDINRENQIETNKNCKLETNILRTDVANEENLNKPLHNIFPDKTISEETLINNVNFIPSKNNTTTTNDAMEITDGLKRKRIEETITDEPPIKKMPIEKKILTQPLKLHDIQLNPPPKVEQKKTVQLNFMRHFEKSLNKIKRNDLEEFVLQKIAEAIIHKSEISDLRVKVEKQESIIQSFRIKTAEIDKQLRDLQMVHQRVLKDLETRSADHVTPIKITRAVGLQVSQPVKTQQDRHQATRLPTTHILNNSNNKPPVPQSLQKAPNNQKLQQNMPTNSMVVQNRQGQSTPNMRNGLPQSVSPQQRYLQQRSNSQPQISRAQTNLQTQTAAPQRKKTIMKYTPMRPPLTNAQQIYLEQQQKQQAEQMMGK